VIETASSYCPVMRSWGQEVDRESDGGLTDLGCLKCSAGQRLTHGSFSVACSQGDPKQLQSKLSHCNSQYNTLYADSCSWPSTYSS